MKCITGYPVRLTLLGLLCLPASGFGQDHGDERANPPDAVMGQQIMVLPPPSALPQVRPAPLPPTASRDTLMFINAELAPNSQVITGAPYSATAATELVQVLADGNRIHQRSASRVFRDGMGRTRWEYTPPGMAAGAEGRSVGPNVVIHDPVAQKSFLVDPRRRQVDQLPEARSTAPAITQGASQASGRPPVGAAPLRRPLPAVQPGPQVESLGEREINGLRAIGTRSTRVIAAGEVGNDKPLQIVTEKWHSPELGVTVMSRHLDPRFGETVYQLQDIKRTEPDPALFVPPRDYPVRDLR